MPHFNTFYKSTLLISRFNITFYCDKINYSSQISPICPCGGLKMTKLNILAQLLVFFVILCHIRPSSGGRDRWLDSLTAEGKLWIYLYHSNCSQSTVTVCNYKVMVPLQIKTIFGLFFEYPLNLIQDQGKSRSSFYLVLFRVYRYK